MNKLKHFPVRTDLYPVLRFVALCGYVSSEPKEFVNPQQYKPEQVRECCALLSKASKGQSS